jgi:prolyl-tRNA editing enzyme YbaK/EbsC (Cys-tRNA(Pro) deacylase)
VTRWADAHPDVEVREFSASTRTAAEAAAAIGCEVGQIVKSLVWAAGEEPLLVLLPGDARLHPAALGRPELRRATPDEVRAWTGYAIGGVPPFGHARAIETVMDAGLERWPEVWAAAGTPHHVFAVTPAELAARARATVETVGHREGEEPPG